MSNATPPSSADTQDEIPNPKPAVLSLEDLEALKPGLIEQRDEMTAKVTHLATQLNKIQSSIKENLVLTHKTQQYFSESYALFLEEWSRRSEYFPDLRVQILQKAIESLDPRNRRR